MKNVIWGETELNCAGVIENDGSCYTAPKGSVSNSLVEIPNRINIKPKFLYNKDISSQDKIRIISRTFINLYYNSKKKNNIGFGQDDSKSFDFDFVYGDINLKEMESFSPDMDSMIYTMLVNHHSRRSKQFIAEVEPSKRVHGRLI